MAAKPLDLAKIRDDAGKRSSTMQHGVVDATGEIYRLADALERALLERDEALKQVEHFRLLAMREGGLKL